MKHALHLAAVLALCTSAFVTGGLATTLVPDTEPDTPWRVSARPSRADDADTVRNAALQRLENAATPADLAQATSLLGAVALPDDLTTLRDLTRHAHPEVRTRAVLALGELGSAPAVDTLLEHVDGHDNATASAALLALGGTDDARALPALARHLESGTAGLAAARGLARLRTPLAERTLVAAFRRADSRQAWVLAEAMASFPDRSDAREALRSAIEDGSEPLASAALQGLAAAGDDSVLAPLTELARTGTTAQRTQALRALARLGDERALPVLAEASRDPRQEVSRAAVWALSSLPGQRPRAMLLELIETGPDAAAIAAANAAFAGHMTPTEAEQLAAIASQRGGQLGRTLASRVLSHPWPRGAVPPAVAKLAREQVGSGTQWAHGAFRVLLKTGDPADRAHLEDLLFEGTRTQRSMATSALRDDSSPEAEALLFAMLDDPDGTVQQSAMTALERRGPAAQAELAAVLLAKLRSGEATRWGGLESTLLRLDSEEAAGFLLEQVRRGTHQEASSALHALASSSEEHRDQLAALTDDIEDTAVRRQVYSSLLAQPSPSPTIVDAVLDEDDPTVRATAAGALARLGDSDALLDLVGDDAIQVRQAALGALSQLGGTTAEEALIASLDDPDLSATALSHLGNLGSPRARQQLREVALDADEPTLRVQALRTLSYQGGADRVALLEEAVYDDEPSVRQAAVSALQSVGTTESAEVLASLLEADDEAARQAAMALQGIGGSIAREHAEEIDALVGLPADTGAVYVDDMVFEF